MFVSIVVIVIRAPLERESKRELNLARWLRLFEGSVDDASLRVARRLLWICPAPKMLLTSLTFDRLNRLKASAMTSTAARRLTVPRLRS
jgi:hypothetical protein